MTCRFLYLQPLSGVGGGGGRLTGKIDRLVIDSKARKITVGDEKPGKSYSGWKSDVKTHKFRQQLMFYKLLVENSSSFGSYNVERGVIEFAEPNGEGKIITLPMQFDAKEFEDFKKLIQAIWEKVQNLDLPDISKYPSSLKGIKQFERDLTS